MYVGKAGTGFTQSMIIELHKLMKPITLAKMPLAKKPDRKNKIDNWATPKYWAEVEFRDITSDGLLRHTTFKGLYDSQKSKKPLVAKSSSDFALHRLGYLRSVKCPMLREASSCSKRAHRVCAVFVWVVRWGIYGCFHHLEPSA